MTRAFKTGLILAATAFAAPAIPAVAGPLTIAPRIATTADMPIEQARYRRHVVRHRPYYVRRHYRRYRVNPGLAIVGGMLGAIAAANAYDYYEPGYVYYPYYAYPTYTYGYPVYGYGWGGGYRLYGGRAHFRRW